MPATKSPSLTDGAVAADPDEDEEPEIIPWMAVEETATTVDSLSFTSEPRPSGKQLSRANPGRHSLTPLAEQILQAGHLELQVGFLSDFERSLEEGLPDSGVFKGKRAQVVVKASPIDSLLDGRSIGEPICSQAIEINTTLTNRQTRQRRHTDIQISDSVESSLSSMSREMTRVCTRQRRGRRAATANN
jgi:hypothetical protein